MTTNELNATRMHAKAVTTSGNYRLEVMRNGRWATEMFDLTQERAERYAKMYQNARAVRD